MGTILKNIVRFTGLAIGVPTALPHRLNVNNVSVVPRLVFTALEGFTTAADATNVTVTRLASGPAAVDVYVEYWHTIEALVPLPGQLAGLVPFLLNPGAGGGGGGGTTFMSNCLIFRPGSGLTGPIVFDTWAALYAQLQALRAAANGSGCYTIEFDPSAAAIYTDMVIPAGAYDMSNVSWMGTNVGVPGVGTPPTPAVIAEGATFTNGPYKFRDLFLYSRATATPPFSITNDFTDVIQLFNTNVQAETAPIPVFLCTGGGLPQFQLEFSTLGDGVNPVLEADASSGANLRLGPGASVQVNALITVGDGGIGFTFNASSATYTENQPLAPGAAVPPDSDVNSTYTRHYTTDVLTSDDNAYPQYLNRFDASGATPITASLPQALLNDNRYQWVLIKETSGQPSSDGTGAMGVAIDPFAGDSIDGVLGPAVLLPGAQTALISRGDGNWNTAWKTASVPEKLFASVVIDPSGGLEKRIAFFNVGNTAPGSGVSKNGAGDWTITFNRPIPDGYFPIVTFGFRDQSLVFGNYEVIDNSTIEIFTYNASGVLSDWGYVTVAVNLAPAIID